MTNAHTEPTARHIHDLILAERPTSGTQDDDDDRDDEHAGENEAPVREVDENTEAPEEFEIDDEEDLGDPEDDDVDEDDEDEDDEDEEEEEEEDDDDEK